MARYTGPKNRIARRFGINIFGRARNPMLHKQNPPGQHGARRKKKSDYGEQMEEKQKLRAVYGMLSQKQLVNCYKRAIRQHGNTAHIFLAMLERRLDNMVFRMKLAPTIFAAQQLVAHGHVLVNGKKVDIRSFLVEPGMVVSIKPASQNMVIVRQALESPRELPAYIAAEGACGGKLLTMPEHDQVPLALEINLPMVCDFLAYSN